MKIVILTIFLLSILNLNAYEFSLSREVPLASAQILNTQNYNTTFGVQFSNQIFTYFAIFIEMLSDESSEVALLYKEETAPYIDSNNELEYDGMDFDGFAQQNGYQFLLVEPQNNADYYFTVLSNISISFRITISGSDYPICPLDCYGQGACVNGECHCAANWVGRDCSIPAIQILEYSGQTIYGSSNLQYVYYEQTNQDDLELLIETNSYQPIDIKLLVQNTVSLPTDDIYDVETTISSQNPYSIIIKQKYDDDAIPDRLIIQIGESSSANSITTSIQYYSRPNNEENNKTIIIAVVCSVGGSLLICLVAFIICRRIKNKNIKKPQTERQVTQDQEKQFNQLNRNEMNQIVQYVDMNVIKDSTENCAICLDLLKKETIRETPCKHVFHAKCIEQWLAKNQYCPFCRFDLKIDGLKMLKTQNSQARTNQIRIASRNM